MRNQRQHPRTNMKCRIRITHPAFGEVFAHTRDLSDGGVYVRHPELVVLQPGDEVTGQVQDLPIPAPELRMVVMRVDAEGSACSSCARTERALSQASGGRADAERRSFPFRLLVAASVRCGDAAFPGLVGALLVAIGLQRLAQQLPRRRVLRIELHAAAQVLRRPARLTGIQVALPRPKRSIGLSMP